MRHEELFVGAVAVVLGLLAVVAAIGNWDGYYRFRKVRWIEAIGGRWSARLVYVLLGVVLIVRTSLEDRLLQDSLAGYADYARAVRYRLLPGVW